ncbi:MAG: DUF4386 domain-containing protein [Phycisphaerales bacterium]
MNSPQRSNRPVDRAASNAAGVLLIAVPAGFMVCFTALQSRFDYPDVLRKPAAEVLTLFAERSGALLPLWYAMFASAVLFIPLSVAVAALSRENRALSRCLAISGVLAGLVQAIGLSRWVFVVPALAARYVGPATPGERASIETAFEVLNNLVGVGIGEHLGYFFTVTWTLLLAWGMRRTRPLFALAGGISASAIGAGLLEPFGVPVVGAVNAIGYTAWSIWLVVLGVLLLRGGRLFPTEDVG